MKKLILLIMMPLIATSCQGACKAKGEMQAMWKVDPEMEYPQVKY